MNLLWVVAFSSSFYTLEQHSYLVIHDAAQVMLFLKYIRASMSRPALSNVNSQNR